MSFCSDIFSSIRGNCRECMTTPLNKKKVLTFGGVVIVIIIIIIIIAVSVQRVNKPSVTKGSDIIKNHPFVLSGNTMAELIKVDYRNLINDLDLNKMIVAVEELIKGNVATQIWDVGASSCTKAQYHDAVSETLEQIDLMKRIIHLNTNFMLITNSADIKYAKDLKKLGSILRVDGGYTLDSKLSILRTYYNLGVRILTITGSCDNPWSKSVYNTDVKNTNTTLDNFGKSIIKEMSRLGMIIDIAGAMKETQLQILDAATADNVPVLLSHSGSKDVVDDINNVDKAVLDKLKQNGGLLLLSLNKDQVCKKSANCTISEVIAHLDKLRESLNVTNIGFGANFGSKNMQYPVDLKDPEQFGSLFDRMLEKKSNDTVKWRVEDLKKLAGENFINLFRTVEVIAAKDIKVKPIEDILDKNKLPAIENATCYTDIDVRYPKKN
uniref:Dipeptidase n=1 Tax=Panstrongylus lignarius TaxID=156445 RepID=A0A224XQC9_9HEMI